MASFVLDRPALSDFASVDDFDAALLLGRRSGSRSALVAGTEATPLRLYLNDQRLGETARRSLGSWRVCVAENRYLMIGVEGAKVSFHEQLQH